ncbi:(2Fe-2S)-binding protein [Oxalobacteraceae bacterium CAVE-383]|nr:(2Fe-2S)-binding protein [Oxalobacteraceae bacterium CAVE-383]
MPQRIVVNGKAHGIKAGPDTPLLYVLRDELKFDGPKFGCGLAQCGACTVHVGGEAVRSCVYPVAAVKAPVQTIEGIAGGVSPHPLIAAFVKHQAAQCGYCINGMVMTAAALLKKNPHPTRDEIIAGLDNNLCRCGTHLRILAAIEEVAQGVKA